MTVSEQTKSVALADPAAAYKHVNLALQGGGVLGIEEVAAIVALLKNGYSFDSITGTSAGSFVGVFLAAIVGPSPDASTLTQLMSTLPYPKLEDKASWLVRVPIIGKLVSFFWNGGAYKGDFLEQWIGQTLQQYGGVQTWGDLQEKIDRGEALPVQVITFDVDRQVEVILPRDYHLYNLDPATQTIASAVRASTSIMTFFVPASLTDPVTKQTSSLYDGGLINNYPWDIASQSNPKLRTLGIRLEVPPKYTPVKRKGFAAGIYQLLAVIESVGKAREDRLMTDPVVKENSIQLSNFGVSSENFGITQTQIQDLFTQALHATDEWCAKDAILIQQKIDAGIPPVNGPVLLGRTQLGALGETLG